MSSLLSLIVLGNVYFLGPMYNIPLNGTDSVITNPRPGINPGISQPDPIPEIRPEIHPGISESNPNQTRRDDYIYAPGIGAHKLYSTSITWNDARKACQEDGAHLAIINSDAESRVLGQLLQNRGKHSVWVGIHDHYEEGKFVTIFGESLAKAGFDMWEPGEPNNVGGGEDCGIITESGKFTDIKCGDRISYICELYGV